MTTTLMYYFTNVMEDLFVNSGAQRFDEITSMDDFWNYTQSSLLDGLYWETWYNDQPVAPDKFGFIYYDNKLLGLPRIR